MRNTKKAALIAAAAVFFSGCGNSAAAGNADVVYNTADTPETGPAPETAVTTEYVPQKYIITCSEIAYKLLSEYKNELPNTMEVTDDTMIAEVLRYDMELADDFSVYMQLISADLFELTIIRTSDKNAEAVDKMLEARRTYLRDQAAFYPEQVAAADAAIVGSIDDVHYLICSTKAEDMEKRLMYYVLRN